MGEWDHVSQFRLELFPALRKWKEIKWLAELKKRVTFVYVVIWWSSFIFLHIAVHISQHHLLNIKKKTTVIYTMEYYAEERKKELLPFGTAWMELESIMLS